jgi:V/A-type H+-transporting ATPase subunit A
VPRERQKRSFELLSSLIDSEYNFPNKDTVRDFFTRLTGLYRNLNYAADGSPEYENCEKQIRELAATVQVRSDSEVAVSFPGDSDDSGDPGQSRSQG